MSSLPAVALGFPWFLAVALALLDGRRWWVGWLAAMGLAANLSLLILIGFTVSSQGAIGQVAGGWPRGVGIALRADSLGVLFAALANGVLLAALIYQLLNGIGSRTFPSLVLFMATGLTGLFLTADAFNFYVFFEVSMTSGFVLASYGGSKRQMRSSMIFVTINLLGSVLFLGAVAALYHVTGTLDMVEVARRMEGVNPNAVALIAATFLAAFGLKLGLFPFHSWLPPVYRDSQPAVAAILSGALANIGSYGLIRFGAEIFPTVLQLASTALVILGGASILYGAFLALSRFPASEVLAYSSIGQAGYILLALAVGGPAGYLAAILYSVVNSLNKTVLFLAAGVRGWLVGGAFAIGSLSVAGIPPAAGFLSKVAVFQAGIIEGSFTIVAMVFVGGALSFAYMFQIYQRRFWIGEAGGIRSSRASSRILVLFLAGLVLILGVWPEALLSLSAQAAAVLPGGSR